MERTLFKMKGSHWKFLSMRIVYSALNFEQKFKTNPHFRMENQSQFGIHS